MNYRLFSIAVISAFLLTQSNWVSASSQNTTSEPLSPQAKELLTSFLAKEASKLKDMTAAQRWEYFTVKDIKGHRYHWAPATKTLQSTPELWSQLDADDNQVPGTSTEKAYNTLSLTRPANPLLVAIIDGGVDINHQDLQGQIWVNEKELNGTPGKDNDGNGYVGDVYGWNFLGNSNGQNVRDATLEVTRELARMLDKQKSTALTSAEQTYLAELQASYSQGQTNASQTLAQLNSMVSTLEPAVNVLFKAGMTEESLEAVNAVNSKDPTVVQAKNVALSFYSYGYTLAKLKDYQLDYQGQVKVGYDLNFDSSSIVGDNASNLTEVGYGNADVIANTPKHGTHCSGIVGALRRNGIGMDGQTDWVKLMAIRAVPNGDERDKDVANAVRYAVDNGAKILNMSFGKAYSPNKDVVDAAFKYAEQKGVLVVHAAGNDSKNTELGANFPNRKSLADPTQELSNWIEVGASTSKADMELPASFSNYGQTSVDLFAPGNRIYSTVNGNEYEYLDGTSMAAPEVAGVAALVWSQYPSLSAQELKGVLLKSARSYKGLQVLLPADSPSSLVDFGSLSVTGGVVNALEALKAAAAQTAATVHGLW